MSAAIARTRTGARARPITATASSFRSSSMSRSCSGGVPDSARAHLESLRADVDRQRPLFCALRATDVANYMPGAVLPKVDRMSMQHSLEVRTPFLNVELARFAERMPLEALYEGGVGKRVLREVAYRHLPRDLIDLPKQGFGLPMSKWARDSLLDVCAKLVEDKDSRLASALGADAIGRFMKRQRSDGGFATYQVWALAMLESWLRHHPAQATRASFTEAPVPTAIESLPVESHAQPASFRIRSFAHPLARCEGSARRSRGHTAARSSDDGRVRIVVENRPADAGLRSFRRPRLRRATVARCLLERARVEPLSARDPARNRGSDADLPADFSSRGVRPEGTRTTARAWRRTPGGDAPVSRRRGRLRGRSAASGCMEGLRECQTAEQDRSGPRAAQHGKAAQWSHARRRSAARSAGGRNRDVGTLHAVRWHATVAADPGPA